MILPICSELRYELQQTKEHYEIRLRVKLDDQQQDLEEMYAKKKESMQ
jgi:hypothetical protein